MSRIGINLLYINPKLIGGSVIYALNLVKEISLLDQQNQYVIYINKESKNLNFGVGDNFTIRVLDFEYSSVYLRYFWEQFILPFYVYKDKIDLLHSLGYVTPLLTTSRKVVSILDINYMGHSNNMSILKRFLLGIMVNFSAIFSKEIITISEFSKRQIIKFTKAKSSKITVTLLSGSFDDISEDNNQAHLVLNKYNIHNDYMIAFSGTSPHKNIEGLIEAIKDILANRTDLKMVLVGHKVKSENIQSIIIKNNLSEKIIFTGFVPDEDIKPLLTNAKVFIFPSLYEGFGIPLLDAQEFKVPVVSSNAGSLTEVGGDAVFYFDPKNTREMRNVILKVLADNSNYTDIVKNGLENRKKFSWKKTAQETINVYQKALA